MDFAKWLLAQGVRPGNILDEKSKTGEILSTIIGLDKAFNDKHVLGFFADNIHLIAKKDKNGLTLLDYAKEYKNTEAQNFINLLLKEKFKLAQQAFKNIYSNIDFDGVD